MDDFERELTRMMRDTRRPSPYDPAHRQRLYARIRARRRSRMLWRAGGSALAVTGLGIGLALLPTLDSGSRPSDPPPLPATTPSAPSAVPEPATSAPAADPSTSLPPTTAPPGTPDSGTPDSGTPDPGTTSSGSDGTPPTSPSATASRTETSPPSPPGSSPPATEPARESTVPAGQESADSG
ncbi:cellulase [Streptomyces sp. NPDC052013]|uniref:cellulase n=1 Tax=Streptomyces sp. NPDC052013 TaxID=3365679 RepID=UPI0037D306AD